MNRAPRLVVFDVDGTLVDSQGDILAAMGQAFAEADRGLPDREAILAIVGLSLDEAIARLVPDATATKRARMVDAYKRAYAGLRAESDVTRSSPLYPHAIDTIRALHARPDVLLGVATGKSARGLAKLFDGHDLWPYFVTRQVADDHPSKPHPSMLLAALAQTGVAPRNAVMVGDTSFDMEMARAAGVPSIGVSWGYHRAEALGDASAIIGDFRELPSVLERVWG